MKRNRGIKYGRISENEPHALIDSEPDLHITEKKKKNYHVKQNQRHMTLTHPVAPVMLTQYWEKLSTGFLPVLGETPTVGHSAHSQDNNELAEMRALFKERQEMKALTERNSVFMERNSVFMERFAEHSRVDQLNAQYLQRHPEGEFNDHPDLDMVSHEQVITVEEVAMAPTYDEEPFFAVARVSMGD